MLIGILRPVWLFHDPYNDEKSWPRVAAYLLVDTGLPAITTAFAVLFLALLRYVCMYSIPKFYNEWQTQSVCQTPVSKGFGNAMRTDFGHVIKTINPKQCWFYYFSFDK